MMRASPYSIAWGGHSSSDGSYHSSESANRAGSSECLSAKGAHHDTVAGCANHTLHIAEGRIFRVGEHDHVAAARRIETGQPRVGAGNLRAEDRLVHKQKVPREQRTFHAAGGDLKGFEKESTNDEEQHERHA